MGLLDRPPVTTTVSPREMAQAPLQEGFYYELQASATILDLAGLSKVKPLDPSKVLPGAAPRISVEPDADFPTLPPISITVPDGAVQLM